MFRTMSASLAMLIESNALKIEVLKTVTVTNKLREATVLIRHRAVLPSQSP